MAYELMLVHLLELLLGAQGVNSPKKPRAEG